MGKTTIEQKNNKFIVVNRLIHPETINERELNIISCCSIGGLIPVTTEKSSKGDSIKGTIVGMTSLKSYFSGIVSRKIFLDIMIQIAGVVKECEKNLLNTGNLMLDWEYIFLTPRTKMIQCLFWPIVNNQTAKLPADFFKEIPFRIVFKKEEDHDYISQYLQFFKSQTDFSIKSYEKMILELLDKTADNKLNMPSGPTTLGVSTISAILNATKEESLAQSSEQPTLSYPNQEKINVCPKCGNVCGESAKFCTACGSPLNSNEPLAKLDISAILGIKEAQMISETTVLGAGALDDGTTVLGADAYEEPPFPYLIWEKTQEKITVDKPIFRIGKERRYCDYFVSDNNAVSRSHANIITREGRYYIFDNNSTNKTYVDERVIPVKKEVEIFSGTKLRLANEDFVFYI
jgi:pSer/pThr/pTyr-binding forkhead associated (FHA) protein